MKTIKLNETYEIEFNTKHPLLEDEFIPGEGKIKQLEDGRIEILEFTYVDPRHPEKPVVYHSGDEPLDQADNDEAPSKEEVNDLFVNNYMQNYITRNILDILKDNGLCNMYVVLYNLQDYWEKHPQLRLAQIVSNAWHKHPSYKQNPEPDIQDVFYFTDAKFLEGLQLLIQDESERPGTTQE